MVIRMQDTFIYRENIFRVIAISDGRILGVADNGSGSITLPLDVFSKEKPIGSSLPIIPAHSALK